MLTRASSGRVEKLLSSGGFPALVAALRAAVEWARPAPVEWFTVSPWLFPASLPPGLAIHDYPHISMS